MIAIYVPSTHSLFRELSAKGSAETLGQRHVGQSLTGSKANRVPSGTQISTIFPKSLDTIDLRHDISLSTPHVSLYVVRVYVISCRQFVRRRHKLLPCHDLQLFGHFVGFRHAWFLDTLCCKMLHT